MSPEEETTGPASQEPEEKKPAKARRLRKAPAKKAAAEAASEMAEVAEKKPAAKKPSKAKVPASAAAAESGKEGAKAGKDEAAEKAPVAEKKAAPQAKSAAPVAAGKGGPRRRVVRARARYVRTSARKARMVCVHIRGKSVEEARAILAFTPREVARDWSKLLESAVANAESNHELLQDDLIVREAYADEGPTIKRFRPRAMGRATPIRKRTSHLTITLTAAAETRTNRKKG
jgi:ribosomal protein L22